MVNEQTILLKAYWEDFFTNDPRTIQLIHIFRWVGFVSILCSSLILHDIF